MCTCACSHFHFFLFSSEQPVKIQILLTDAQEEVVDALSEASLGPPSSSSPIMPHSPAPSTPNHSHSNFRENPECPSPINNRQLQHTHSDSQELSPASSHTVSKPSASSMSTVTDAPQMPLPAKDRPEVHTHGHNHHPTVSRSFSVPRSSSDHYSIEDTPQMLHSQQPSVFNPSPSRHPDTAPLTHNSISYSSPSPCHMPRSTSPARPMPVERWAENVSRYYNSQNASQPCGSPCEELSELDSLYRASLRAPSKPRGSCGPSPHHTGRQGINLLQKRK